MAFYQDCGRDGDPRYTAAGAAQIPREDVGERYVQMFMQIEAQTP
jgi:hypothetical protein